MVDKDLLPLADKYLASLDDLRKIVATQLAERQSDTSALARSSQVLLGAGTLVAIAIGALLAWSVTRSIVHPVQMGRQSAERIAHGDLTRIIASKSRQEPGQLLQALATMQARLEAIVGSVRNSAEGCNGQRGNHHGQQ
jgi:methyl-accepting chemotaxis protein